MTLFSQLARRLVDSIDENIGPKISLIDLSRALLGPKLHVGVKEGFFVDQGDAAISEGTVITGGLATCTAVAITTGTHNFLCHADSTTSPEWLSECVKKFREIGGTFIDVKRLNCHGCGLNEPAESITRKALEASGLMAICEDVPFVSALDTVVVKVPDSQGERICVFRRKLEAA